MATDDETAAGWITAIDAEAIGATQLKRKPLTIAKSMLIDMCRQPHLFAKPKPLPEVFADLVAKNGLRECEKAALHLGRLGAAIVRAHKSGAKPMTVEFSLSPPGPMI